MAAEENQFAAGLSIPRFTCAVVYGFNRAFDVDQKVGRIKKWPH
jgi:hypothetical protein